MAQFAAVKYSSGAGRGRGGSPQPVPQLHAHLCPPASVDEGADGLVRPRSTGVEVGAVPGFYQAHEVGTFALQGEQFTRPVSPMKAPLLKEPPRRRPTPPAVLFLSSDIRLFSWRTPASGSGFSETDCFRDSGQIRDGRGQIFTHYERLLVDVVHVQSDQVLPAAQVQPPLVLVHQEDAVVAGVEGETEGSRRFCIRQLCGERRGFSRRRLKQPPEQRSDVPLLFFLSLTSFTADSNKLLLVP